LKKKTPSFCLSGTVGHVQIEQENSRLKKLVADLSLDNAILREAASGNF